MLDCGAACTMQHSNASQSQWDRKGVELWKERNMNNYTWEAEKDGD